MKKRKFLKLNSEKTELLQKIKWLKGDVENKTGHIKRLLKERDEARRATSDDATSFEFI